MKVLVVGFPYVRERYFATFRSWPEHDGISFLLPKRWTAKNGKVVFTPPGDANVHTASAYFHDSHTPIIGGLLKGFMRGFLGYLWSHRKEVDLVYGCSEPTLLTTLCYAVWSKILGKKFISFTWENIPYEQKLSGVSLIVHRFLLRLNLALSDGLICGNVLGATIHRAYTKKPIAVIPMNGVDPEKFKRQERKEQWSHLSSKIVYTFVGAIGYRKGIHLIVKALPEVLKSVPNAHVVIAGSGEYEKQVDNLIIELGLSEHITRLPWVDDKELIALLSVSHVFLYPSIPYGGWAEQFGYSMAEASLMELPVVATQSGSISDVVIDGQTGRLVKPDDQASLAQAMIALGVDGVARERMGNAGRDYISRQFSHQTVAEQFYSLFASLVNKNKPQA